MVRLHLTANEGWLLDSLFKGRGLFMFPNLLPLMQIMAEAIVEGEAEGDIDENSLWLLIDLTPAGLISGQNKSIDLLEKLYKLALEFYKGKPIPDAFKNAFKEVKAGCKDTGEDLSYYLP